MLSVLRPEIWNTSGTYLIRQLNYVLTMSTHFSCLRTATGLVAACLLISAPALADSTSSASSAASTSIGSSSTSLNASSNSSTSKDKVAEGPYTVVAVLTLANQPDALQLRLQQTTAVAGQAPTEFTLTLPRVAAEREQLALGQTVLAQHRPYGLAFALADSSGQPRPFFLVLDDNWHRELHNRPVGG